MDEMSRFVMGVADLTKEECHTTKLHDDMTLSRLMAYLNQLRSLTLEGFLET